MKIEEIENIEPTELFSLLREESAVGEPAFFIAGSGGSAGESTESAYSYMGIDPFMVIEEADDPFIALKEAVAKYPFEKGPFPFSGGAVGYFSYDQKDKIFNTSPSKENSKPTPLIPESVIAIFDPIIVCDHAENKSYIVERGTKGSRDRSEKIKARLKKRLAPQKDEPTPTASPPPRPPSQMASNLTRDEYISKVASAKRYIAEGDIYQINIAQEFKAPWTGAPFSLFKSVTETYPAPFSTFLDFGSFQIISNSPERLLKIEGKTAQTEPIKGTRKRGVSKAEDLLLIEELKGSSKERAEHVMIVDLERNDLGRICETGSVKVADFERVLTLPGLHHMVSVVTGKIKDRLSSPECLRAIFPGGSITGAPKIRAMEIIEELEPTPRGLYTGTIGWMDFSGDLDFSIAIRTAIYTGESIYLSVGSGIVTDSVPEEEYDETILKGKAFFNAINKEVGG